MELAAPVALRRVEPGMRAALVCSVEALVWRRVHLHLSYFSKKPKGIAWDFMGWPLTGV